MNRTWSIRVGDTTHDFDGDDDYAKVIPFTKRQVAIHPKYEGTSYYDVAVIELDEPLVFNEGVQPVCLPRGSDLNVDLHADQYVTLLGMFFG